MNTASLRKVKFPALVIPVLFFQILWMVLPLNSVYGGHPTAFYPPIGMHIKGPLKGHRPIHIDGLTYFFLGGIFYRPLGQGYVVVTPPIKTDRYTETLAWEGDQIQVVVPTLNVRSGPGTRHAILKEVKQGDVLVVQSSSSGWYYVKLPDSSFGWVMVEFTTLLKSRTLGNNLNESVSDPVTLS